jgi:hypothetical protein
VGIKDRIQGIRQYMSTPVSVWMADTGSDPIIYPGQRATVKVKVDGENDGSVERIDLSLRYSGQGTGTYDFIPLGQVPLEVGLHEIEVDVPTGLPPSVAKFNEYVFFAKSKRSKGLESDALSAVDVIGRVEDLYWPDGPRTGQDDGADDVRIEIDVDTETVDVGAAISGTVKVFALADLGKREVTLVLGATETTTVGPPPKQVVKFHERSKLDLAPSAPIVEGQHLALPFKIEVPADVPPTVHSGGESSVVWQLRAQVGKADGWRIVGVLDPTGAAGNRNHRDRAASLLLW